MFINNILQKYLNMFVIIYLDNILIYLENKTEHIIYIKKILKAIKKVNLQVKLDKLFFYITEIKYLGYIILKDSIQMDLKKVKKI